MQTAAERTSESAWRVVVGAGAALVVIALAIAVTWLGNAPDPSRLNAISAIGTNRPSASAAATQPTTATTVAATSTAPTSTTQAPTTVPPTAPPTTPPVTAPVTTPVTTPPAAASAPATFPRPPVTAAPAVASAPARPTVAITGPTVVRVGGQYQWKPTVTGAVRGVWSGSVLDAEKGLGATVPWSVPSGVFYWNDPTATLAGRSFTITLTVYNAAGASAQATFTVAFAR